MPREIVFPSKGKFACLEYEDRTLQPDEVRGPTIASLISPGTEFGWVQGAEFPIRPGYAAVFKVEEVGTDVTDVEIGEILFCMGHHRQTQQCSVAYTLKIPSKIKPEVAVLIRLMGVSMTTLMTTKARTGDKVVVCGAGPVGLLAAHNFLIGGYDVLIVEPDDLRRKQAEQSGIPKSLPSMPLDDPEYLGKVSIVLDCSGNEAAVVDGCKIVRKKGEVVLVGVPWRAQTNLLAHDVLNAVFFNFVELRSGWEWEIPVLSRDFVWEELLEGYNNSPHNTFGGFQRAMHWLGESRINLEGLIAKASPENPTSVYENIQNRTIGEPFVVFDWLRLMVDET
ncbi:MAG: hypothetical protein OXC63_06310 [Aestuariivita sp.]|nr:hypothetical protein [Aestuariivita sp.]MCY4346248.1 hypothetical protein [Aestuariivita sp.]